MVRPFSREGLETRIAIRTAYEANPAINPTDLRRQFSATQAMVDSALGKTAVEWQALLDVTPAHDTKLRAPSTSNNPTSLVSSSAPVMPGIEQGIIKFTRKPAKMGEDFIFWIPRVYIKNGLVDPNIQYEVHLKKK